MGQLSKEVVELTQCFLEITELPKEEVRVETEGWTVEGLVKKSLGRRVSTEVMAHEFRQQARLKSEVVAFNMEHGFLSFWF